MDEIAVTKAEAGLTPALFEGISGVYGRLTSSERGQRQPEDVPRDLDPTDASAALRPKWPFTPLTGIDQ